MELPAANSRHHSGAMRSGPSALTTRRRHMPPGEARGRSFGNLGEHGRQAQGSRREAAGAAAWPVRSRKGHRSRRDASAKALRAKALRALCANSGMWLSRGKRRRTARAPKRLTRRSIRGSAAAFSSLAARLVCAGAERLGHERGKRHEVDAEAHVDALDLVLEQAQEMLGLARRRAQARLDHGR